MTARLSFIALRAGLFALLLACLFLPSAKPAEAWGGNCNDPNSASINCYLRQPERPEPTQTRKGFTGANGINGSGDYVLQDDGRDQLTNTSCKNMNDTGGIGSWFGSILSGKQPGGCASPTWPSSENFWNW